MQTSLLPRVLASRRGGFLTCVAVALLSLPVLAQEGPDDDPDTATGYVNNMFHHSSVDSINLYNGSLTIPIPIGPSYPVGPKLKFQAMLTYSSKVWEYGHPSRSAPPDFGNLWSPLVADPAIGLGWTFSLGAIKKCGLNQLSNCYVGPDGSEHQFFGMKTKDASQLLLKGDDTNGWEMWDGDGNHYEFRDRVTGYDDPYDNYTHTLGRGRNGWYLSDLTDPFNNAIHVTYHPNLGSVPCWGTSMVCTSSTGSPSWIPATIAGPSWSVNVALDGSGRIQAFSLPVIGATPVTWLLGYGLVSLAQTTPNPASVSATTLTSITLPTTTHSASYNFSYKPGGTGYTGGYGGLIQTMTLPTQGVISYIWSTYSFYHARRSGLLNCSSELPPADAEVLISVRPAQGIITAPAPEAPSLSGCVPGGPLEFIQYADQVAGVARRTETLGAQNSSTDYVQLSYPFSEQGTPTNRCDFRGCGSQTLTLAISPPGIDLKSHATATLFWGTPSATDTSPPRPGDRTGADIETRVFDFDPWGFPGPSSIAYPACGTANSFCPGKAVRVTQRTFEYDSPLPGNRRVLFERTWHQAPTLTGTCVGCKYTETAYSPSGSAWETNGRHYGTEIRSGNLAGAGTETRTTTTTWTPVNWASGPTGDDVVLPNLSSQVQTTEGTRTIKRFLEYDVVPTSANGFLKGQLTWDDVGDTAYVSCRFADGAGSVDSDLVTSFASTGQPTNASTYCTANFTPSTSVGQDSTKFGKKYTYQNGQLLTARWINGTNYLSSWYARRHTREPKTGWVTDSYDSASVKTHYDYDNLGRVTTITPDGETPTNILYNSTTQTTATRSGGAGLSTWQRYEYDGLGRLIREKKTIPGDAIVKRFTLLDLAGHDYFHSEWLIETAGETVSATTMTTCKYTNQGGAEANYTAYRPTVASGTYTTCFDPFGRPQKVVGAKHNSIQTIYRTDGLSLHSDSLETVTSYCVNGWFTGATCNGTSPLTPLTTSKRDTFGRILTVTEPSLDLTTYAYDTTNKLTSVTQTPQLARTFTYDASGNTKTENTPEKGAVTYTYGGLGNLLTELLPGPLTVTRSYDFAGRLTTVVAGGQTFVSNCYDGAVGCFAGGTGNYKLGKLTRRIGYNPASSPTSNVTQDFTYSGPTGRLSSRSTSVSGGNLGLVDKWAYNSLGLLSNYWHPRLSGASPFLVSTLYDQGLPVTEYANGIPMVRSVTYLNSGALNSYKTGLGTGHDVTTTIAQDATQLPRPGSIGTSGASTNWSSGTYTYDGAGNIVKTGSDTFSYDDRSRLLSAFYSGNDTQFFCYDRWGNRTAKAFGASPSCTASWSNNKVPGGVYDARGNMTGNGAEVYTFDNLDRQIRHVGTTTWNYLFDAASERVVKVFTSGSWIYTLRDEGNRLATEYSGSTVSRDQVYLGNLLVASYANWNVGGNTYVWTYYSSDHLGSPRVVTDIAGTTRDTPRYWPYGEEAVVSIGPQRVRFASMERDTEASRFFDHARNHEFNLGRFLSPDKVGGKIAIPQSWNRYTYSLNNPLNYIDPTGLDWSLATAYSNAYTATAARLQSATQHFKNAPVFRPQAKVSLGGAVKLGPIGRVGVEASLGLDPKTGAVSAQLTGEATTAGGKGAHVQTSLTLSDKSGILPNGLLPTVTGGLQAGEGAASSSGEVTYTLNATKIGIPLAAEIGIDFKEVAGGLADLSAALGEGIREAFRQQAMQDQMANKQEPCAAGPPHCN